MEESERWLSLRVRLIRWIKYVYSLRKGRVSNSVIFRRLILHRALSKRLVTLPLERIKHGDGSCSWLPNHCTEACLCRNVRMPASSADASEQASS